MNNGEVTMKQINYWNMKNAEEINPSILGLPTAQAVGLIPEGTYGHEADALNMFKGIRVQYPNGNYKYVQVSSNDYKVVQHEQAFRPLIDALTISGVKDFKFSLNSTFDKAELRVFTTEGGYDGVQIGFSVVNSFHGHDRLHYGLTMNREQRYIEIVGYRQVCSNGMKVRVPIENAEIIRPELKAKIETLLSYQWQFKHTGNVLERANVVKYVVEALALLREPMEAMIKKAEGIKLNDIDKVKALVKLHVGNRYAKKVMNQYSDEASDLWGLYNAITFVASHDEKLSDRARNGMLDKASELLLAEI